MIIEIAHFLAYTPVTLTRKLCSDPTDFFQMIMDRADKAGMAAWRAELVEDLTGDILEIGCGTGMMFPHYSDTVRLTAIEPDPEFLPLAEKAARKSRAAITLSADSGEKLPFEPARFDAVVLAMVLCSVPSMETVLREAHRVLKPGGQLRLIEHVQSDKPVASTLMDAFNPLWRAVNGVGCNMNRRPEPAIRAAGFSLGEIRSFQVFTPGLPAFPMQWITAVR
jgi:SAM-dependent methyltransferase